MQGPRTHDPRPWRGRDWPERQEYGRFESPAGEASERGGLGKYGTEPNRRAHEFERDRGQWPERDFSDREFGAERGREFAPELHDPRTGERVPRHAGQAERAGYEPYSGVRGGARYPAYVAERNREDDRATPWDRDVDTRYTGEGYHYPGDARYPDASGRRDARRLAHVDEHGSWDPDDRDESWRRGEYGSRLYGNVVGAATPSGTAGIRRYPTRGAERRGPKGYARSDERLRDDICERLSDETWIDLSAVDVHVADGRVTLEGDVPDRFSKYAIEDIADNAWGVKEVDNRLRIRIA